MPLKCTKAKEPTTITNELIKVCALRTYCDGENVERIAQEEGLDFSEIDELNMEFQNILKIRNIWQFQNLRKLELSNNVIECIEGLEELPSLICLDLSFNRIEAITGLSNLKSLTDLSLSHNKIKKVENLECLGKLEILSLNDNFIDDFADVQYLNSFRSLRAVAFKGNPIEIDDVNYKSKIIAYIPSIFYLDFRWIGDEERKKASEVCAKDIEKLDEAYSIHEAAENEKNERERICALYKDAFIDNMVGSQLLNDMLQAHEMSHLMFTYPLILEKFNDFCTAFDNICAEWVQESLANHGERMQEISDFSNCADRLKADELSMARASLNEFHQLKQSVFLEMGLLRQADEDGTSDSEMRNLATDVCNRMEKCWATLMSSELDLFEKLCKIHDMFEVSISEMTENFSPRIAYYCDKLQECDERYVEFVKEYFVEFSQKSPDERQQAIRAVESEYGQLDCKLLELLKQDGDRFREMFMECHTVHKSLLHQKCESLQLQLISWLADTINVQREGKLERHREKLIEITSYWKSCAEEFHAMCKYCNVCLDLKCVFE